MMAMETNLQRKPVYQINRRLAAAGELKFYTTHFTVEKFLNIIPDPHDFFADPSNQVKLSDVNRRYVMLLLCNTFRKIPGLFIKRTFTKHHDISAIIKELKTCPDGNLLKWPRKFINLPSDIQNISLLQELAYYSHIDDIDRYLENQKKQQNEANQQEEKEKEKQKKKEEEKEIELKNDLMFCSCCFDEEVLPENIFRCENGCQFCKECIAKSSEVLFGEGKLQFPCLINCSAEFSLQTLQMVLPPKLFLKIVQKKDIENVKAAAIENLEICPFCDFAIIIPEGYNILTCMNPECMKDSCRICKEPSHIPFRCDEIEKDAEVKARVFVENKMTEALLRKCWKCGINFFKEEGCNKMTCPCGANMCYICGQPVTDYTHFNGNGGDGYDLCPLFSDVHKLNEKNVYKAAKRAKMEMGNVQLKFDPSVDVHQHYEERRKKYPIKPLQGQEPIQQPLLAVPLPRVPPRAARAAAPPLPPRAAPPSPPQMAACVTPPREEIQPFIPGRIQEWTRRLRAYRVQLQLHWHPL